MINKERRMLSNCLPPKLRVTLINGLREEMLKCGSTECSTILDVVSRRGSDDDPT